MRTETSTPSVTRISARSLATATGFATPAPSRTRPSYAVPAILSGRYAKTDKAVPTLRYYPVNLFTALARHYEIFASMRFQQLCPPRACEQNSAIPGDSVRSLLSDLGLVWLHIVLPETLTEELPPVVGEWAEFGRTREAPTARGKAGVEECLRNSCRRLTIDPRVCTSSTWCCRTCRSNTSRPAAATAVLTIRRGSYRGRGLFEGVSAAYADTLHQRHLAQVGFADRLVGDVIGRLREVGAYEKALVIITADHGASYREGRADANRDRSSGIFRHHPGAAARENARAAARRDRGQDCRNGRHPPDGSGCRRCKEQRFASTGVR